MIQTPFWQAASVWQSLFFTTGREWVAKGEGTRLACVEIEAAKAIAHFVAHILPARSHVGTKAICCSCLAWLTKGTISVGGSLVKDTGETIGVAGESRCAINVNGTIVSLWEEANFESAIENEA